MEFLFGVVKVTVHCRRLFVIGRVLEGAVCSLTLKVVSTSDTSSLMMLIIVVMREGAETSKSLFAVGPTIARLRVFSLNLVRVGAILVFEGTLRAVVARFLGLALEHSLYKRIGVSLIFESAGE